VVLTSMVKRVDLAVWQAVADLAAGRFTNGDTRLGLKEGGVTMAEVRIDFPNKSEVLQQVDTLRARIIAGELKVPANQAELDAFTAR
jgi:basic membrane protein A and related proteins